MRLPPKEQQPLQRRPLQHSSEGPETRLRPPPIPAKPAARAVSSSGTESLDNGLSDADRAAALISRFNISGSSADRSNNDSAPSIGHNASSTKPEFLSKPIIPPRPSSFPSENKHEPIAPPPVKPRPTAVSVPFKPKLPSRPEVPPRPESVSSDSYLRPTVPERPMQSPVIPARPVVSVTRIPENILDEIDDADEIDLWHPAMMKLRRNIDLAESSPDRVGSLHLDRFAAVDAYAIACPASETSSLERLARYLLNSPVVVDDIDKVRAVFCWIANNVAYDFEAFKTKKIKPQSGESVLASRSSVCDGYSNLFLELMNCVDRSVRAEKITGASRGYGTAPGNAYAEISSHAWNVVFVCGEPRFVECTWAAGYCGESTGFVKAYRPTPYFLVRPCDFVLSHLPSAAFSKMQFLPEPITLTEWIEILHCGTGAKGMRVLRTNNIKKDCSILSYVEIEDDFLCIVVEVDEGRIARGSLSAAKLVPVEVNHLSQHWIPNPPHFDSCVEYGERNFMIANTRPSSTHVGKVEYIFRGYCNTRDSVCNIFTDDGHDAQLATGFRVRNLGPCTNRKTPQVYGNQNLQPIEPLSAQLTVGSYVCFTAQGAGPGAVVTPQKRFLPMKRQGNDGAWFLETKIDCVGDWVVASGNQFGKPEVGMSRRDRRDRDAGGGGGDRPRLPPFASEGDWTCTNCFNLNWAKRIACNQCNAPKPSLGVDMDREGRGGGFKERDDIIEYKESRYQDDDDYDDFGRKKKKRAQNAQAFHGKSNNKNGDDDDEDGDDDGKWDAWADVLGDDVKKPKSSNAPKEEKRDSGPVTETLIEIVVLTGAEIPTVTLEMEIIRAIFAMMAGVSRGGVHGMMNEGMTGPEARATAIPEEKEGAAIVVTGVGTVEKKTFIHSLARVLRVVLQCVLYPMLMCNPL
ncbi:hypothetical protein HDU84_009487 [Entophlyctis sp. JEL0112]|nr:hypothetical protein HDU84_009487 [Entophlyctis sp. JEL0112]